MKMHLQIHNVDDPHGWGTATSTITLKGEDLALPLDDFVERYLKPAFVNAKQRLEDLKNDNEPHTVVNLQPAIERQSIIDSMKES